MYNSLSKVRDSFVAHGTAQISKQCYDMLKSLNSIGNVAHGTAQISKQCYDMLKSLDSMGKVTWVTNVK